MTPFIHDPRRLRTCDGPVLSAFFQSDLSECVIEGGGRKTFTFFYYLFKRKRRLWDWEEEIADKKAWTVRRSFLSSDNTHLLYTFPVSLMPFVNDEILVAYPETATFWNRMHAGQHNKCRPKLRRLTLYLLLGPRPPGMRYSISNTIMTTNPSRLVSTIKPQSNMFFLWLLKLNSPAPRPLAALSIPSQLIDRSIFWCPISWVWTLIWFAIWFLALAPRASSSCAIS